MNIEYYVTYDLPVPYRNMLFYPVSMKDYFQFNMYSKCLTIDKNSIPDPKIITMSNLEYMYFMTKTKEEGTKTEEEEPLLVWFDRLLSLCLKNDESFSDIEESIKRYGYNERKKPIFYVDSEEYSANDFEEIKNIIAKQNMVELVDENISKEVRDSLEEAREFKRKLSKSKPGSIEDYIISLSIITGWKPEYIYSMSIRRFTKSIRRLDNLIHYKIYLQASMSGMVEFKDKSFMKHWLVDLEDEDKYSDVAVGLEEMKDKISFESAK
jgi:hypothetical protein